MGIMLWTLSEARVVGRCSSVLTGGLSGSLNPSFVIGSRYAGNSVALADDLVGYVQQYSTLQYSTAPTVAPTE